MNIRKDCRISATLAALVVIAVGCAKPVEATGREEPAPGKKAVAEDVSAEKVPSAQESASPFSSFKDDTVLVEVNGEKLTYGKVIDDMKKVLETRGAPAEQIGALCKQFADQAIPQAAEQFVMKSLLKAEACASNFTATAGDVDAMVAKMVSQFPPGLTLSNVLAMSGITEEAMRKEMLEVLPIDKMLKEITKDAVVEEKDISGYYEENGDQFTDEPQVRASHILIKVAEDAKDEEKAAARAKLEGIREQILAGADFAALAATNSACPSKEQGGDLGFFGKGQMVPAFEEVAFSLPTNQVSKVVETRFGYHLIKVTDRKEGGKVPLAEVHDNIKRHLEEMKKGEMTEKFEKGLLAKAKFFVAPGLKLFVGEEDVEAEPAPAANNAEPAPVGEAGPAPAAK